MTSTYEKIATTTAGGSSATVTFNSISGSYTDIVLISSVRTTSNSDGFDVLAQFNSDTGSNYSITQMYGTGSSAASNRETNRTSAKVGLMAGNLTTAGTFASNIAHIQNYSNSTTYKTVLARRDLSTQYTVATVSLWRSTSAINSITLNAEVGNFASGSTFTLYGIKAE